MANSPPMCRRQLPPFDRERYHPVVIAEKRLRHVDLGERCSPDHVRDLEWTVGGYGEQRSPRMYSTDLYRDGRTVHMGIDIWAPGGTPVYAFADGRIHALADNDAPGDYGPTIVTEHVLDGTRVWALHGHLSRPSLERVSLGESFSAGTVIGFLGSEQENGGWAPHLHFQLSIREPHMADMPGVVHVDQREDSLAIYPDPRTVLGPLY